MASKSKRASSGWQQGSVSVEDLPPSDRLAHQIVTTRRDLAPSVERIMAADLNEEQRLSAMTAFEASLRHAGDPNRDPRVAIANAAGTQPGQS